MSITAPSQREGSAILSARRDEFTEEIIAAYRSCSWAELALLRQGWTGERLQKAARRITADYIRLNVPHLTSDRRDELADFVTEKALKAVLSFHPQHPTERYGMNGGNHFDSWIGDVMMNRCMDWYRSKAEGNGDRRYGNDNRIVLTDDPDPADHDTDFEYLVDERRRARWQQAADSKGMTLSQFVVSAIDVVTSNVLEVAA